MNKREHILGTLLDLPHGMYVQEPDGTLHALLVHWHFVQVPGLKCEVQATTVTQEQWVQVMGTNPSFNQREKCLPVEQVSYNDILVYLDKLNKTRNDGYVYRLPTEAEYEVALGGLDKVKDLDSYVWYDENSQGRTHPVGTKKANEYRLHDMFGNVYQFLEFKDENHIKLLTSYGFLSHQRQYKRHVRVKFNKTHFNFKNRDLGFRLIRFKK